MADKLKIKLSIADQFEGCQKNGMDIIDALFTTANHSHIKDLVNKWYNKLDYIPNRINAQKKIADTLYKKNKYYLD